MDGARTLATLLVLSLCVGVGRAGEVDRLIADLRSDDVAWNASRAQAALASLPEAPIHELQAALDSDDWQQRQMACEMLWRFLEPSEWILESVREGNVPAWRGESQGEVTRRLLEVTFEGLRSDALPWDQESGRYTYVFNAAIGFRAMSRHAREARDLLERGLESDDPQQRLLCAMALGRGGIRDAAEAAAGVLLPHLRDNDIEEDAKWCVWALYGFGDAVVPALERAIPDADRQQRELILLLLLDIETPPNDRRELQQRQPLNSVSGSVFDPAIEGPLDDCLWWIGRLSRGVTPRTSPR